jgi:hypothetical protein
MANKREERRRRAEEAREEKLRQGREKKVRRGLTIAAGVLIVLALAFAATRDRAPRPPGKVWSAEHGHWHDS